MTEIDECGKNGHHHRIKGCGRRHYPKRYKDCRQGDAEQEAKYGLSSYRIEETQGAVLNDLPLQLGLVDQPPQEPTRRRSSQASIHVKRPPLVPALSVTCRLRQKRNRRETDSSCLNRKWSAAGSSFQLSHRETARSNKPPRPPSNSGTAGSLAKRGPTRPQSSSSCLAPWLSRQRIGPTWKRGGRHRSTQARRVRRPT